MSAQHFFVAGAQKSASSSLHEYLKQHPDLCMSEPKETNFFSYDHEYEKGMDYYASLFKCTEAGQVRGESSIGYMVFPSAIERIGKNIKAPKFIFILRNPVDRVYSHYWFLRGRAYEEQNFLDAFMNDMEREPLQTENRHGMFKFYYQFGLSYKWLRKYFDAFGSDSIHVLTSESLRSDPLGALNGCFKFLGVSPLEKLEKVFEENVTPALGSPSLYPPMMSVVGAIDKAIAVLPSSLIPVSKKVRNKFVWLSVKYLMQPLSAYPKITIEQRGVVASYYRQDVDLLRELTGKPFQEWSVDFPLPENLG